MYISNGYCILLFWEIGRSIYRPGSMLLACILVQYSNHPIVWNKYLLNMDACFVFIQHAINLVFPDYWTFYRFTRSHQVAGSHIICWNLVFLNHDLAYCLNGYFRRFALHDDWYTHENSNDLESSRIPSFFLCYQIGWRIDLWPGI